VSPSRPPRKRLERRRAAYPRAVPRLRLLASLLIARRADVSQSADPQAEPRAEASLLFVCLGNICRSPTAEAVFREIARREAPELRLLIDSAGTADYHIGEPPDPRSQAAARRRGYDMSSLRARMLMANDFERFDLILAMDRANLATIESRAPEGRASQVRLFLEFAADAGHDEVPDPYYGGPTGFEQVLDLVESASRGLIEHLRAATAARTSSTRA